MRNMSFSITTRQMKDRTKTVTRRLGWWFLKAGDKVMAVEKAMGLRKGEKIKRLYPIEVVSAHSERLCDITQEECVREGFPDMTPSEFVSMICRHYGVRPTIKINRISFKELI